MDLVDLDAERAGERRQPAAALQRSEPSCERDRAQHRRRRPLERGARERLAQHAHVEGRVVGDQHAAPAASCSARGSTSSGAGAASSIACEMPVKRWMPRPSGFATPTSELVAGRAARRRPRAPRRPRSARSARPPRPLVSVSRAMNSADGEGQVEHGPHSIRPRPDGATALARSPCTTFGFMRRCVVRSPSWPRRLRRQRAARERTCARGPGRADRCDPRRRAADLARLGWRGTIVLLVSNQSGKPQKVTFETDELGGRKAGRTGLEPGDRAARDRPPDDRGPQGHLLGACRRRRDPRRARVRRPAAQVRAGPAAAPLTALSSGPWGRFERIKG